MSSEDFVFGESFNDFLPHNVNEALEKAKDVNKEAVEKLNPNTISAETLGLIKDSAHLKFITYYIAAGLMAACLVMWSMFVYLDSKIEKKMDYMNLRIDAVITSKEKSESGSTTNSPAVYIQAQPYSLTPDTKVRVAPSNNEQPND